MSLVLLLVILLVVKTAIIGLLLWFWLQQRQQQQLLKLRLEASEAQYHQVMFVSDLCMAVLDETCHVTDWNPSLERLYGATRAEALGQQFFLKYAPPREGPALSARVMAMRGSDDVFEFSFTVPVGSGLPRVLHWRARHFTDLHDGRRYLSLVGNDVTALETALEQLAGSEARFRQMFESVPVALALIDPEGRLRMVNTESARFFGYDAPEQMVALNVQELIHPDDRQASALALAALQARSESLYQMETCYLRRDGVARWGNARGVLIELAPGQQFFLAQISDVHERKQTEKALMESERRLATLIANLSGAVYRYDFMPGKHSLHHDCVPEFLSEGVEMLTGQQRLLFLNTEKRHTLGELLLPEDRPLLQQALASAMDSDGRFEVIYRLRHGISGVRWIAEHGLAWQRPDGSWTVDGHLTDITAERQAREAEQVYRTLVADTHTGYICLSATGRVLDVNEPYCAMFGLEAPEKIMGHALAPMVSAGYADTLQQFLGRVISEGGLHDVQFHYQRPDGVHLYTLVNAIAVPEDEQTVVKCLLVDITRTKIAERARRESEQRYRSLFDTNINGICFLSLDGAVEAANPALCRMLGLQSGDLANVGLNLQEITAPAWQEADARAREQILMRGWCDSYRKELRHVDGSHVPVSIQAWLVRDDNEVPQRIMCVVRDITDITRMEAERDQLQQGLRQAQKMEAVGQLAGGIAHDFNNILASILGYAELAARRQPQSGDAKLGVYLEQIHAAGERARDLIRQLLLFSRAGSKEARVQELPALLQETTRMLRPTLPASLRLRTYISQELPPVCVDSVGMQQVVMNLVINARDACEAHGEVKLIARHSSARGLRCASCHEELRGNWVEVAVSDRGTGITPELRERIFDPFFTTKGVGQGTGMGLAVVHGVVHEFGGHIVLDSSRGATTFRVLLPEGEALPAAEVMTLNSQLQAGRGESIMVVDDDALVAGMLGELLRSAGYEPLIFTDSTKAAMQLEDVATPVAALITDQVMPGLEGDELMHLARRYRPALPVIRLSAQGALLPETVDAPVLVKPVQGQQLLQTLQHIMQHSLWQADRPPGAEYESIEE
ncbi:MAG: PAS domain S-box protein [Pedobacter sp.]|nr:PAS domain S-box protein [Pedobacter sp.]